MYVISYLVFLILFVPCVFGIGALAYQAETGGPMILVVLVAAIAGMFGGGIAGEMAFALDKMTNH